jgi:hypothetical protein
MAPNRLTTRLLLPGLLALGLLAPSAASAAEAISNAKALGGSSKAASTPRAKTTGSATGSKEAAGKESLSAATATPADGQTISGSVSWEVTVNGATPTRVDFAVDGSTGWSQTVAPYLYGGGKGRLDTTKLANGSHTLSATAYGSKGAKSTTKVTVVVKNSTPVETPTPETEPEAAPGAGGGPIYWGATIGSQLTGSQAPWDMSAVTSFEQITQKPLSLVQFFQPFASCPTSSTCSFYNFPTTPLENIRQHGAVPVLSWSSQSIPSSLDEPDFQLSDVISGRYDSFIRSFATAAKNWGHPFFLRFNWEMNGNWFPWSEGVNGNKSGEYVAAWRHVHDIFTSVGASNVSWVWCPNVDWNNNLAGLRSMYPGDAYVDWTGLDGYNWGTNPAHPSSWKTFGQIFQSSYRYITEVVSTTRPMMIGEVASSEYGGSKAAWIREMLNKLPSEYPKIRALLWFDKFDDNMDWPVETSSSASAAFAQGLQSSAYVANSFSTLAATTIQPLG